MAANIFAKFAAGVCFNTLYQYNLELFPTNMRSSVLAVSIMVSRSGSILAPFVIYLGLLYIKQKNLNLHIDISL